MPFFYAQRAMRPVRTDDARERQQVDRLFGLAAAA